MAILSQHTKLAYKTSGETYTDLTNLQSFPEIGNNAPEQVDITTLGDDAKKYMAGLIDSSQELTFGFLYEKEQFNTLTAMKTSTDWKISFSDGTSATFKATPSVKIDGKGVGEATTYTLNLGVESLIVFE